ncbi:hypothetical protein OF83DRAFT_1023926, partial [Amylostereum chailletii]
YPAHMAMRSVHNTPIEGLWHWWLEHSGNNLKTAIVFGQEQGIFHQGDELHVCLFYCIWPTIVQTEADKFVEWWNGHQIRRQNGKLMPSG